MGRECASKYQRYVLSQFAKGSFLRWAGGKQRMVSELTLLLKNHLQHSTYFEPFLGAGSVFFSLGPHKAVLSDLNGHLISTFEAIKKNPVAVFRSLRFHAQRDSECYYYRIRRKYNRATRSSYAQAARFIYLNRACFNGIFRVNQEGQFNVPYGWKNRLVIPSSVSLTKFGGLLERAQLRVCSYDETVGLTSPGDVVYLDPPYPPLNGTSFFTHYTKE